MITLCDKKCNDCPLMREENSRMVTRILNELQNKFGDEVTKIVNGFCPNLTCCFDCHIDDFCHIEGCELIGEGEMEILTKTLEAEIRAKINPIDVDIRGTESWERKVLLDEIDRLRLLSREYYFALEDASRLASKYRRALLEANEASKLPPGHEGHYADVISDL